MRQSSYIPLQIVKDFYFLISYEDAGMKFRISLDSVHQPMDTKQVKIFRQYQQNFMFMTTDDSNNLEHFAK